MKKSPNLEKLRSANKFNALTIVTVKENPTKFQLIEIIDKAFMQLGQ